MASAAAAPLVLPSLQELGLPPVATAKQVVAAVADIIRAKKHRCTFSVCVGDVKDSFARRSLHLTPPANWAAIVRQAAQVHYKVIDNTDAWYKPRDRVEFVSIDKADSAAEDPALVLEPPVFTQMTDAEVVADVQAMLRRGINAYTSRSPLWWYYDDLRRERRPSWDHCHDLILAAAEPHWDCTVSDHDCSIGFDPKE
jgi:hypothetical protein